MSHSILRSPPKRQENPPFVPSPRWLSESPARTASQGTPSTSINYAGQPFSPPTHAPSFSRELKSPIPPPPANLYQGNASAFNVDPGIPFLATAGPTDGGSSHTGSVRDESPREKNFVGGFVTGIKKAVRRSLRESAKDRPAQTDIYTQPPQFRDSGYGSSTPQLVAPPPIPPASFPGYYQRPPSSHRAHDSPRAPSETLLGDHEGEKGERGDNTVVGHQEIRSPEAIMSPVSADPEFGSDYAQMEAPTPPPSDVSLNTYLQRARKFVQGVSNLPWVAKERVTADYYPERTRRRDEPKHHPAIAWHSQNYSRTNYRLSVGTPAPDSDAGTYSENSTPVANLLITPQRGSYAAMNLDEEFENPNTPLPPQLGEFTPRTFWDTASRRRPCRAMGGGDLHGEPSSYGNPTYTSPRTPAQRRRGTSQPAAYTPPTPTRPSSQAGGRTNRPHSGARTPARAGSARASPSQAPYLATANAGGGWEEYPPERGGYVPYEFSEHYYGDKYGPGIHPARPPLAPVASSAPSPASPRVG
ncbi:hypothetical protein BDZ97DRAFT_1851689 [Flammula alnicola]|nr:hypothetical protein BDZ97DRAFT_1851689 [Flammula alnicola]